MRNDLEAVLFDMDGTLVETEEYWGEALFALAERLGGRMSPEARARTIGTGMRFSMTVLYEDLGLPVDERQLHADARWVEERTAQLMAGGGIRWQPGAGGTACSFGTPSTAQPAASPAVTPTTESSMTTAFCGATPSAASACR